MAHTSEDLFRLMGASNHCKDEREATDFYSTDPDCINDLLAREEFGETILEPCCGSGKKRRHHAPPPGHAPGSSGRSRLQYRGGMADGGRDVDRAGGLASPVS